MLTLSDAYYDLSRQVKTIFYLPYIHSLLIAKKTINSFDNSFNPNGSAGELRFKINLKSLVKIYFSTIKISYRNILGKDILRYMPHRHYYKSSNFKV